MPKTNSLTNELVEKIIKLVREGNRKQVVAYLCGIELKQLNNWLRYGKEARRGKRYKEFYKAYHLAEAEFERELFTTAVKVAKEKKDLKTIIQILEKRFSDAYVVANKQELKQVVETKQSKSLQSDVESLARKYGTVLVVEEKTDEEDENNEQIQ